MPVFYSAVYYKRYAEDKRREEKAGKGENYLGDIRPFFGQGVLQAGNSNCRKHRTNRRRRTSLYGQQQKRGYKN